MYVLVRTVDYNIILISIQLETRTRWYIIRVGTAVISYERALNEIKITTDKCGK